MAAATRKATKAPRSKAYTEGLKIRRRWLGKAYVDKAFRDADDFTIDLQHSVTEHGWGASWARGVLPLKTRSFMNLAMISALNRPHELEIHLRAAIRNGMTKVEIKETFLHVACYCGWPAALDGFRIAKKIFAEAKGRGAT
jgi:4-carboxymuconolactone decarboxylase